MKNFIFIAILAVAFFSGCEDKKAEQKATEQTQTEILNRQLKQQCADNNASSCKELGNLYFNGDNSPEGFTMAFEYHKKACNLNAHLCSELANLYFENGRIEKAYANFAKNTCKNNFSFCKEFGDLYFKNKDYEKAFKLHQDACRYNSTSLCKEFGDLYFKNKDYEKAFKLHQDACGYDSTSLCKELVDLYFKNKDYEKAFNFHKKLCETDSKACKKFINTYPNKYKSEFEEVLCNENSYFCKEFGDLYFKNKDYEKAFNFHKKFCETDLKACKKFINTYPNKYKSEFGEALCKNHYECEKIADTYIKQKNYKKAKEILRQISDPFDIAYNGKNYVKSRLIYEILCDEKNDNATAAACNNLGNLYNGGRGVARNMAKAFYYYKKSCDAGSSKIACNNLGYNYYNGDGTKKDYAKAKEAWQKSCDKGSADSCAWLGELYALGRGVRQDLATAKEYFGKGCDMGSQKGCDGDKSIKRRNPQGNVIMRQEMILR